LRATTRSAKQRERLRVRATPCLLDDITPPGPGGTGGKIRVPTRSITTVGSTVDVEISLGATADEITVSGVVRHVGADPTTGASPMTPVLEIEVVRTHAHRVHYVVEVLEGTRDATARAHRRVPVSLHGRWLWGISPRAFPVTEIGAGGVFVESLTSPHPGARVDLQISFDSRLPPIYLRSEVMWVSRSVDRPGFGARFALASRETATKLGELISHAERRRPGVVT